MKHRVAVFSLLLVLTVAVQYAEGSLTLTSSRAAFESQGTITYNYGFEDFSGLYYYFPGDPWTTHGVTYTSGSNIIVGPGAGYGNTSNVLCYNWWTPLTGTIQTSPSFDMFGFDVGVLGSSSVPLDIYIDTNTGSYSYLSQNVPFGSNGMSFYGFTTSAPGEYFTGFTLVGASGSAPAIDNVTLGDTATIPEPAAFIIWSLLGAVAIGVGRWRKWKAVY
ncbi:MAG: hypothetical protein ABSG68_15270 [Thermoguttaceae bacterium]|jgi:hypothetical protein